MTSTDGLLLVDKPAGLTSHDVVATVRRATGISRVGHTGTLDPFATGLLVVLVGRATRLAQFIRSEPKKYVAAIAFGHETATDDATGEIRAEAAVPPRELIAQAVAQLTGTVEQVPPDFSAKQVGGRRAYAAARQGAPLQLQPVTVRVFGWELLAYANGTLHAAITCGAGTYIRALARDLGRLTGSAAHLAALRRTQAGAFAVDSAVSLDAVRAGTFGIQAAITALDDLPLEELTEEYGRAVRHGRAVPASVAGSRAALVDQQGLLLAIADRHNDQWHPRVVLADA